MFYLSNIEIKIGTFLKNIYYQVSKCDERKKEKEKEKENTKYKRKTINFFFTKYKILKKEKKN